MTNLITHLCIENGENCEWSSQLHGVVSNEMWGKYPGICEIKAITNAQDYKYWADKPLYNARDEREDEEFDFRKNILKRELSEL